MKVYLFILCLALALVDVFAGAVDDAWAAAGKTMLIGPQQVKLGDKASFELTQGYAFIPAVEASAIQKAMGNTADENMLGMVIKLEQSSNWFMTLEYEASGHIKDDDQGDLNADEILQSFKDGEEEDNERRREEGFPELHVKGWIDAPSYDPTLHRLLWSLEIQEKSGTGGIINANLKSLGREGLITVTFVGTKEELLASQAFVKSLSQSIQFNEGKRYADFNPVTDKVAEYGLMGLIGGVALKKLGLFALITAFVLKFFKFILIGGAAIWYFLKKLIYRRKEKVFISDTPKLQKFVNPFPDTDKTP